MFVTNSSAQNEVLISSLAEKVWCKHFWDISVHFDCEENIQACCWMLVFPVWSHINNYWCMVFQWYILSPYRQILNIKSKHIITHNGITHGVLADTNNASIRSNIRIICCDLSCDLLLIYQFERIQTHIYKVSWMVINACNIQHLHAIDFWSMVADPVNDTVVPRAY